MAEKTWNEAALEHRPLTLSGEAGFAASGTCLCIDGEARVWIGLGGDTKSDEGARILFSDDRGRHWTAQKTELVAGQTSGVFSIVFADRLRGVAVGGTYDQPQNSESNVVITEDGGKSWRRPRGPAPGGYRSCVAHHRYANGQSVFMAVGTMGCDRSRDGGKSWQAISDEGFHAVAFSPSGDTIIAVGGDGKIGRWSD